MELAYFVGRFHVVVLHLPIALALGALLVDLVAARRRDDALRPASMFLWGGTAATSVVTASLGYLHWLEGGFAAGAAVPHMVLGTAVAVGSTAVWLLKARGVTRPQWIDTTAAVALLVLVVLTGHFGGNLTHGSTFLVEHAPGPIRALAGLAERGPGAPEQPVRVDEGLVERLATAGFQVRQTSMHAPTLRVSLAHAPGRGLRDEQVAALLEAADAVVELNLRRSNVHDAHVAAIARLTNLTHLYLDHNAVTDAGLPALEPLRRLEYLNLVSNPGVTDAGLAALGRLPALRRLYLWGTSVTPSGIDALDPNPALAIDLGTAPGP